MIVALRWQDGQHGIRHTYESIGREFGLTAQAVESLHRRALDRWPVLAAMFARKKEIVRAIGE